MQKDLLSQLASSELEKGPPVTSPSDKCLVLNFMLMTYFAMSTLFKSAKEVRKKYPKLLTPFLKSLHFGDFFDVDLKILDNSEVPET